MATIILCTGSLLVSIMARRARSSSRFELETLAEVSDSEESVLKYNTYNTSEESENEQSDDEYTINNHNVIKNSPVVTTYADTESMT